MLDQAVDAERVQTHQRLGTLVDLKADFTHEELIVDLLHELLARRHGGGGGWRLR